jgi:hypothetical protein
VEKIAMMAAVTVAVTAAAITKTSKENNRKSIS